MREARVTLEHEKWMHGGKRFCRAEEVKIQALAKDNTGKK